MTMIQPNISVDPFVMQDFVDDLRCIEEDALLLHDSVQMLRIRVAKRLLAA